jgi:hypothetical protein
MSQAFKLIKKNEKASTVGAASLTVCRARAEFKSNMVMTRFYVDLAIEEGDRDRAEYIYSQLMEQCKKVSRKFGFVVN